MEAGDCRCQCHSRGHRGCVLGSKHLATVNCPPAQHLTVEVPCVRLAAAGQHPNSYLFKSTCVIPARDTKVTGLLNASTQTSDTRPSLASQAQRAKLKSKVKDNKYAARAKHEQTTPNEQLVMLDYNNGIYSWETLSANNRGAF